MTLDERKSRPSFIDTNTGRLGLPHAFDIISPSSSPQDMPMGDGLASLGLLEFFESDINPTLIIDIEQSCIAYENHAFRNWKQSNPRECHGFAQSSFLTWLLDWSRNTNSVDFAVAGRTWRTNSIRRRWMVMTSYNETRAGLDASQQQNPPTPPASLPVTPCAGAPSMEHVVKAERTSPVLSISSSSSTPTEFSQPGSNKRVLDWTKYDVQGLSAHTQLIKTFPWQTTPVGGIETWTEALRSTVVALNANTEPRVLIWGPEHIMIYNEACAPLFGQKHPESMGARGDVIWAEAWKDLVMFITRAEVEAKATRLVGIPLTMHRHGYDEETFWITNFIPVIGSRGRVAGVMDEFTEITNQVVQDRRRDVIGKLNDTLTKANDLEELWRGFINSIQTADADIPYCAVYTPTMSSHANPNGSNTPKGPLHRFSLHGSVGLEESPSILPASFDLNHATGKDRHFVEACCKAWNDGDIVTLQADEDNLPPILRVSVSKRAGGAVVKTVCLIPVPDLMGNNQLAFVVLALTARRPYDNNGVHLVRSISDVLSRAASIIFLPEEQRRLRQRFEEMEVSMSQQLQATSLEAGRKEARYERLFANAPVAMYVITPDQRLQFYNDAYLSHTGSNKALADQKMAQIDLVHDEDHESVLKLWTSCLEDKVPVQVEYRMKKEWRSLDTATGKEIIGDTWVMASAAPELDDQGNVLHVMGWMLDISERKYHEKVHLLRKEALAAETRFANLASEAPMGMYLLRPDGSPIYLNDAYFDILGFSKEEFQKARESGVGWDPQILDEDKHIVTAAWMQLSQQGIPINIEYRVHKPWQMLDPATGTEMTGPTWLQGTAFAEKDEVGNVVTVQGFVTDISEKKFSERLLAERLEEALETKRQADRFIDLTSHEMRNPLSAILQSADGILTALNTESSTPRSLSLGHASALPGDIVETIVDAASTIVLCANHQKRIVDDILTLSKLDSNLLVISPDQVSLPALIDKSFKMFDSELDRTEIHATMEIEQGYRDLDVQCVMLDSSRVLQVVINLLTNAIKFTQYAATRSIQVFLNASRERPEGANHGAKFIPQLAKRSDRTESGEWGTGEVIYLQVAVQDSGKGITEEELKMMFHRFQQASPKTYKQYGGSGLGLFISRELTELQGGQIGVHSEAGKGSTFTFYIKARRAPPGSCGIIPTMRRASTPSRTRSSSRSRSRESHRLYTDESADTVPQMTVPPQRRASVMLRRSGHPKVKAAAPVASSTSLHVLVVEDNEINQRVMANQLRRLGCVVHLAGNGLEALEFLKSTRLWNPFLEGYATVGNPVPLSVILMDLEMPVLGGMGCVRQIRELQKEGKLVRHVPVIAVTANARSEQIAQAVEAGMDCVVTKPFRIPELVPQMDALVARLEAD